MTQKTKEQIELDGIFNKSIALQRSIEIATKNSQGFAVRFYEIQNDAWAWNFGEVRFSENEKLFK